MLIKLKLVFLFLTGFSHDYSKLVDDIVSDILERGELVDFNKHSVKFLLDDKTYSIWINGLSSMGCVRLVDGEHISYEHWRRPSIKNIEKFYKKIYLPHVREVELKEENKVNELLRRN
ncbi:hypothetical protein KKJ17_08925 [Xenorhabdus bovienii]|uniref:hypothetical protein n=1 Tax=Xenorhabdus bovienii TaxID=40576 RepID=UPI0023B21B5F|nr:hypothetical protein [Xenorhabdus bovienii]MDE9517858.1 hypothetical protein [Xenorhabdus bovienii]